MRLEAEIVESVLSEVIRLRDGKMPVIDHRNSNRYCIVASEDNGTKTAYCFGVPIYNNKTRRLVKLQFQESGECWKAEGSDAGITVRNDILLEDRNGFGMVKLPGDVMSGSKRGVRYGMAEVRPTLNGFFVRVPRKAHQPYEIRLLSGQPFMNVRANDRCFSLMREEFKPFMTVSCIGTTDGAGRLIAPCSLEYQRDNDNAYTLTIQHNSPYGSTLLLEVNLHEDKIFQDTTVESLHPDLNNAFGGTAFIGNTTSYGEQWLYSRPDFSKLPELYDKQIRGAILHLPTFGGSCELTAYGLTSRFCSFGSNWDNKVQAAQELTDAVSSDRYQSLNITNLITDHSGFLKQSEGLILRPKNKTGGFSAVSTGDSCFAPQILEVNFR